MDQTDDVTLKTKPEWMMRLAALLAGLALLLSLWNGYSVHAQKETVRLHVHIAEIQASILSIRENQSRQLLYMENAIVRCFATPIP